MKKIFFLLLCLFVVFTCVALYGCKNDEITYTEIGTWEELKNTNMSNIRLIADIDGGYETIEALSFARVDGNGHTIKNVVVHSTDYDKPASLFFRYATDEKKHIFRPTEKFVYGIKEIKNLTVENITIQADANISAAVICAGNAERIENVHVKNCSIICKQGWVEVGRLKIGKSAYVGSVYGGNYYDLRGFNDDDGTDNEVETDFECSIVGCTAENVTVELVGLETDHSVEDIYLGGIAGACNNIEDCHVSDVTLQCTSQSPYNDAYVAGIVAHNTGIVSKCSVKNSTITATALSYQKGWGDSYSTSLALVSGIAPCNTESSEVKTCFAAENELKAKSAGNARIGGISAFCHGKISNSYAASNHFWAGNNLDNNNNDYTRYLGGVVGKLTGSVTSCFSYDNDIADDSVPVIDDAVSLGGLLGYSDGGSVSCAATYQNTFSHGIKIDEFGVGSFSVKTDCYVTSEALGNTLGCTVLSETDWLDANAVRDKLLLTGNNWHFEQGKMPCLLFE